MFNSNYHAIMKKSIENLYGRKHTGGRIIPMRSRRKFEIDRYPNEALIGNDVQVTRRVRGDNCKTALKTVEFANVSIWKRIRLQSQKYLKLSKTLPTRITKEEE